MSTPIILLMGPSGVGKTTLANRLAVDWNYVHIDYDQWGGDVESFRPLQIGWDQFKVDGNTQKFRALIKNNISDTSEGAILSFPSDDMLIDLSLIKRANELGMHTFIMYADADTCRQVFIEREMTNGRGLPAEHWDKYNAHIYEEGYLTKEHTPYLLKPYNPDGQYRSKADLLNEVNKRIVQLPKKISLNQVTLMGIDCVNVERIQKAMDISQEKIDFTEVKLLSSIKNEDPRWVEIEHIGSIETFSEFCIKKLIDYVDTEYVLLVQYDGFVLNPHSWSDKFLNYDYIGAPWHFNREFWFNMFDIPRELAGHHVVGNGGFSLRSKKFLETSAKLAAQGTFSKYHPEDLVMCVYNKELMEHEGVQFAPYEVARDFSIEGREEVYESQFGFHGLRWTNISKSLTENPQHKVDNPLDLQ